MRLTHVHSFLVLPGRHDGPQQPISGAEVPGEGSLYEMLCSLFDRAHQECDIEVVFLPEADGVQGNPSKDMLETYARGPTLLHGRKIAEHLQQVTTRRSGLGLLFLLKGESDGGEHNLVVSRFPADSGVLAQERAGSLTVEFIERVFMRSTKAYKSALLSSRTLSAGFQDARAIDRQMNGPKDLSEYWIKYFMRAELRTTGPLGTRRLADALRLAVRGATDPHLKQELLAATQLMRGQQGATRTAAQIISRLGLSDQAEAAITQAYPRPDLMGDRFRFDLDEFNRSISYRSVELDNGAILTAEDAKFGDVFQQESLVAEGRMRYSTTGAVIDQKLRKTK